MLKKGSETLAAHSVQKFQNGRDVVPGVDDVDGRPRTAQDVS